MLECRELKGPLNLQFLRFVGCTYAQRTNRLHLSVLVVRSQCLANVLTGVVKSGAKSLRALIQDDSGRLSRLPTDRTIEGNCPATRLSLRLDLLAVHKYSCPITFLFEAESIALLGKRIVNVSDPRTNRDFGQRRVLGHLYGYATYQELTPRKLMTLYFLD